MVKVKYYDTVEPQNFEKSFKTEQEACEWISVQMSIWWDELIENYWNLDVTWLNRYMDCGDTTEIYIPDTSIVISCELVNE